MQVDKIFIINLEHRKDRLEECKKIMDHEGLEWERFNAIKYNPVIHGFKDEYEYYCKTRNTHGAYALGSFGCMLSHYLVIKTAKERGYKSVLILEDDFYFYDGWKENYEKCMEDLKSLNWNLFYLTININHEHSKKINITDNIYRPYYGLMMCSYIIKETLYDFILDNLLKYGKEIDMFYAKVIQERDDVFAPHTLIAMQRSSFSDIEQRHVNYNQFIK